jgi:single-strand DNA-binding protein
MYCRVELIGHLGADPEVKHTQSGAMVANLRVATSERWRDKQTGERREKTEWHRVVIWNEGLAKVAEQYLKKGSKVFISGKLQTRKWTDQQNIERYSTEIVLQGFGSELVMLDGKEKSNGERTEYDDSERREASMQAQRPLKDELNDEIPF